MLDKEWYTQREIAGLLNYDIRRLYPIVAALRRIGAIQTTVDPEDERIMLIHRDSRDAIRKALHTTGDGTATA